MDGGTTASVDDSRNMYNGCYCRCINVRTTVARIRSS